MDSTNSTNGSAGASSRFEEIMRGFRERSQTALDSKKVYELRKMYLDSKAGIVSSLMKQMRSIPAAEKAEYGRQHKPPIKILSPGRVFRSDDDATHSPMFSQMEGLVVDKGITLCDLQGMLDVFVQKLFGEGTRTRLRPSYFPFTEPSVEVDVSCFSCGGKGCRLCKGTGWIEILGAGVVNRKVLENCGIDPEVYSGFAFGIGIERVAMLKYGINNIKLLFESDLRVLDQIND